MKLLVYLTIGVCLVVGLLFGLFRGWKKALIRFGFVTVAMIVAYFTKDFISNLIFNIKIGDATLKETILNTICTGELEDCKDTIWPILYICATMLIFIAYSLVAMFISWIIYFVLSKIFIHSKSLKLLGAFIGLACGLCVGIIYGNLLTGLSYTTQELANVEIEDKTLVEYTNTKTYYEAANIESYNQSKTAELLKNFDSLIYNNMTSATLEINGETNTYTLKGQLDGFESALKLASQLLELQDTDFSEGLTSDNVETIKELLSTMDTINGELTPESKEVLNDLVATVSSAAGVEINDFDLNAINYEKSEELIDAAYSLSNGDDVDVSEMVSLANDSNIASLLVESGTTFTVDDESKASITSAIENGYTDENGNQVEYTEEEKNNLYQLFGITD